MKLLPSTWAQKLENCGNPILIKELRQGMRSKFYTIMLLGVQVVMLFYLIFDLTMIDSPGDRREMEVFFWVIVGLFMLGILPLMGTGALSSENRESRLDLLVLTRLSARGIVYGKWLAIVAQGTLLITSLLPYLILRYYVGSVEFHESLLYALILLAYSSIVTGFAVSLSVIRSTILRWVVLVFAGFWMLPISINAVSMLTRSLDAWSSHLLWLFVSGLLLTMLALEFAAARFSPIRENHDTPKRVIPWILLGLAAFCADQFHTDVNIPLIAVSIALCLVVWDGLCRPYTLSPSVYEPFVRWGWAGRLVGRIFYPGWFSAGLYGLLSLAIYWGCLSLQGEIIFSNDVPVILALSVGIFSLPFAIILYTPLARRRYGLIMFLIQLGIVLLTVLLRLADKAAHIHSQLLVSWIPTSTLLLDSIDQDIIGQARDNPFSYVYLTASLVTTGLSLLAIAIKARGQNRGILEMERAAIAKRSARKAAAAMPSPPPILDEQK